MTHDERGIRPAVEREAVHICEHTSKAASALCSAAMATSRSSASRMAYHVKREMSRKIIHYVMLDSLCSMGRSIGTRASCNCCRTKCLHYKLTWRSGSDRSAKGSRMYIGNGPAESTTKLVSIVLGDEDAALLNVQEAQVPI